MRRHSLVVLLSLASALLLLVGARVMFNTLMLYDDEGYVLLTLRNYVEHGALYREVYTQYGPLPYAVYSLLHGLGMPINHLSGRLITLLLWTSTALVLAGLVARWTRSLLWSLLTLTLVFFHLWLSVREPSHPGSIVAWFVALLAAAGFRCIADGKLAAWSAVAGVGMAALLLTKINTGVFVGLAFVALALSYAAHPALRRHAPWMLTVFLIPLPFLLMRQRLESPWVFALAVLFALSAIGLTGAAAQGALAAPDLRCTRRELLRATLMGALVAVVVLVIVMPRGTSFAELIEGILFGPLRHPIHFDAPLPLRALVLGLGIASAVAFLLARHFRSSARTQVDGAVVVLRLALLAVVVLTPFAYIATERHNAVFWWAMPWLWVCVWPLAGEAPRGAAAKAWLGFLALGQWLHAYPVPGTQLAWSGFLALPLVTLANWEAFVWLRPRLPAALQSHSLALVARGALLASAVLTVLPLVRLGADYPRDPALRLAGADLIRLPATDVTRCRILSLNAAVHAQTLYSAPGMFSFNLWSDRPTPTLTNVTQWFHLINIAQQQQIIAKLQVDPRACIIIDTKHLAFLAASNLGPTGPLYDYLERDFTTAFSLGSYEFRVQRGRRITPYFMAEVLTRPAAAGQPAPRDVLLQVPILLAPGQKIARVELSGFENPKTPSLVLDATTARFEFTPISGQGDATGPAQAAALPAAPSGPTLLSIYFDRKVAVFSLPRTMIPLRGEDGSELAMARLRQ